MKQASVVMGWLRRLGKSVIDRKDLADAPGSALLAIAHARDAAQCELRARLYLYKNEAFIISSIQGRSGLFVEIGEPAVLTKDIPNADLGKAVCDHLLRYDGRDPPNLRDKKVSEWPAYRSSKARSIKRFKEQTWAVGVQTQNTVITADVAPMLTLHPEVVVRVTAPPRYEELGAALRRGLQGATALRDDGVV